MAQHTQEENSKGMPTAEEVNSTRLLSAGSLRSTAAEDCSGIRSLSFSRLFSSFRVARASSLDIDELASAAADADADSCAEKDRKQQQLKQQVCRTQSLPMTSIRRLPQHKNRVADSSSLLGLNISNNGGGAVFLVSPESEAAAAEEEVAEEEAVCRICMVALSGEEGGMKLECRCKGELALAHRDCAVKWFSIKGNATCDVCSHDVLNLPVTLRRISTANPPPQPPPSAAADAPESDGMLLRRVWHGTPVLVAISVLAYFCFLEQLLVGDHGTAALAISLPFAFVLGLFSSLTTTKMVSRRYIWTYSAVQFLFIVLFTHLFYRYVRIQAVIAIILSTFAGFSFAICTNALLLQIIRWRVSLASPSASDLEIAQP